MSDLVSGGISFTGLGSGTDFQTMIDQLIEVESINKKRLEIWKSEWEVMVEGFQEVSSSLLSLKSNLAAYDTPNEFLTKTASSSSTDILSATANADAENATHEITVNQLAKNAILVADTGFSDKTTSVNDSGGQLIFAYTYQGTDVEVEVADGTSLENLASVINNHPDNDGVRASLIYDGSSYHLQLRGLDQGSGATLSFNATLSTLSNAAFDDAGDFTTTQAPQNAQIKVNGFPPASNAWIEGSSNTFTETIEGLTLNLKSAGSAPPTSLTVTVATDFEAVKENVRTFVDQINEVRTLIKELTEFDELQQQGSVLTGNYGVQLLSSQLKGATAGKALGFEYLSSDGTTGDLYSSLSHIGIKTDAEEGSATVGLLVLDETEMEEALLNDPDAFAELFAADFLGTQDVETGNFAYYSHVDSITQPGSYDFSYTVSGGSVTGATINGNAANISVENGRTFATSVTADGSEGIVVEILDTTQNGSGQVRLKQGKVGELADLLKDLTNSETGPMAILEENYDNIIDNIDKKIEREETRLADMEYALRMKFARLEATLGQYDSISSSLNSQIGQLPTSG